MSKDDTAVEEAAPQETAVQEAAPVETNSLDSGAEAQVTDPESDDFFNDIDAEVAAGNKEEDTESGETPPEETQGQPRGEDGKFAKAEPAEEKPLAPKSENRFQKLANENRELKERLELAESRKSQIATEQELLNEVNPETGDYYTPQEAERLARQQTLESNRQSAEQESRSLQVQQTQENLGLEANQVATEFPIFREFNSDGTKNKEYNPDLTADFEDLLSESLVYEMPDGNQYTAKVLAANGVDIRQATLVGSYNSPLKLAKIIAKATKTNAPVYQAKAQKSVERMTANADVSSGATQATKTKVDPMMEAFDEEASRR